MENTISITIPDDLIAAVEAKFAEIQALLKPIAVRISDADKLMLLKIGDKTIPFVNKVAEYAASAPEFAPDYLDMDEFRKDKAALDNLQFLSNPGLQVIKMIEDTMALVANDSLSAALVYYHSVKQASTNGVAKAKPIYDDLSQRFPGRPRGAAKTAVAAK